MERDDRAVIEGLFGKLAAVERETSPVDGRADVFIAERLAKQAKAPYLLAMQSSCRSTR